MRSHNFRTDIQVARGLAIILVLLFHGFENYFSFGYLGVDIFFVISGFVVTPLLCRIFPRLPLAIGETVQLNHIYVRLKDFYLRRIYRLAPALGVTVFGSGILIFFLGPVSDHLRFASQGFAALIILGNLGAYRFSGGNYFNPNPNPLIHLWSLSAEEQIYLFLPVVFFAILLIPIVRTRINFRLVLIFVAVLSFTVEKILLFLPSLLENYGITDVQGLIFFSPISRVWQFCLGGIAVLSSGPPSAQKPIKTASSWFYLFLFTLCLVLPFTNSSLKTLLCCALFAILLAKRSFECIPRIFSLALTYLGDRSYSIYLVHMPIIYLARYSPVFGARFSTIFREQISPSIESLSAIVLSIAFGSLSYKYIEQKFRLRPFSVDSTRVINLRKLVVLFTVFPITVMSFMHVGASNGYWGLDKNIVRPAYAADSDPNCRRDGAQEPCFYPTQNPKGEILLIGDSHAGAMSQAFVEAATETQTSAYVWALAGCQFWLPDKTPQGIRQARGEKCLNKSLRILDWLTTHPTAIVFLSIRSSSIRPTDISISSYNSALIGNLRTLQAHSKQLIVVGPNPEFPDLKFFVSQPFWVKSNPKKSFPVSEMLKEPYIDMRFFATRLPDMGINIIDTIEPFCSSVRCSRKAGNVWLFRDYDHLSIEGSRLIIPRLVKEISNATG